MYQDKNKCNHFCRKRNVQYLFINLLFQKMQYFLIKSPKKTVFEGARPFFRRMERLTPKMNITFPIPNKALNIFSYNYFFEKRHILLENCEKPFFGGRQGSILIIRFYFIHFPKVKFNIDHFVLGEHRER